MTKKWLLLGITIFAAFGISTSPVFGKGGGVRHNVLVTTFPIYQIVRNVTQGRDGIRVDLMIPSQMGCPHDYALTPQDMQKLARADLLVINGLGMEEFLGAPVEKANPAIRIIDSSTGIKDTLQYSGEDHHDGHGEGGEHAEGVHHEPGHDHGELPFEWAGAFQLEPGVYRWAFAKVDGTYADPAMKFAYIVSGAEDPIEQVEEEAKTIFEENGKAVRSGGQLISGNLYNLEFDSTIAATVYQIAIDNAGMYVFFTEHHPSEFEAGEHFFKTEGGNDVEPLYQEPEQGHDHHHGHHHHAGANPHIFASPRMTAQLALNIAAELSKVDPEGAAMYFKNAQAYSTTMSNLADEMAALGNRLKNNRVVEPHGIFDYLARDMNLAIVAVLQPHGQEPSAAEMVEIVKTVKEQHAGAIFTEPQYPEKIGKVLAKETGIPVAMLDPVATGPEDAPLDYYETAMRQNMKILEDTLGLK